MKVSNKRYIKGSKIPVSFVIDYVKAGHTINYFLKSYPWIERKDVIDKLEEIKKEHAASLYVS